METTAYRPSRASTAFDADQVTVHPSTASYIRERAEPHDPIPLFLSDPEGEPDPREFAPFTARPRVGLATQIVAGVLAASAIAVLVTLFQSDISRLLVVNAREAVVAATETAPPPAVRQVPTKDPARVSNPTPPGPNAMPSSSPNPMLASADTKIVVTPSREAIATAYQAALQTQAPPPLMPVQAPSAAPPQPATPAKTLDADTLTGLMTRARSLITVGDITSARLLLERAANAQDASAAFLLGQTYDPAVLGTSDTRSITADATAARDWYQRAAQLGSAEARQRLTQFQN